jgi:hypothetical protein
MAPALRMVSSIPSMLKSDCVLTLLLDTCKQDDLQIFLQMREHVEERSFGLAGETTHSRESNFVRSWANLVDNTTKSCNK